MPITSPQARNWWSIPIGRAEKTWLGIVVVLGVAMFVMMPIWHAFGAQNSPTETYRVSPDAFWQKVDAFNAATGQVSVRTDQGVKPIGDDVYLGAMRYFWVPNTLVLEAGRKYRIHVSSRDVNHGFSIHREGEPSQKANFQVVPGYEYVLTMTFDQPGIYNVICQEYCGLGHQIMIGKIIVEGGN
ncbi:MAG TPA: cytochrome C oxidase subunit II [Chloroflexota bacterium]|nr:cytochrome C oxidase subunit II [Chloroflexota bacterium]